ncbi:capsular polysaccharide biosynthesis protein [Sporosarcina luteola]|uniref:Capsular polysaccharide biosynthesis protein n=1 Tax=Sporosarcina luteola TaxID=582850 RepID=A0A511Z725_9BACL|nr:Wzz/FepE/Etk N-terminal domain-containing protein [Sporosarcina luteola]GEN83252.1 capsular polysaccharide biosynthesis protein [Sporosarcina luteola]
MEDKISLYELLQAFKKRLLLNIGIFLFVVSATGLVSYFLLPPNYQSSTQILVNKKESGDEQLNSQDIQTNLQLINTYRVIIKSPVILSQVIEKLNLQTTPDLLTKKISVTSEQNSQVVNVTVKDRELKRAAEIANMTADVFQKEISELMNVDNVTILSPAINKSYIKPITPNTPLNIIIAAVVGLMIGVGITFLIEFFDTTVKTEEDIQELVGFSILGFVSPASAKKIRDAREKEVR